MQHFSNERLPEEFSLGASGGVEYLTSIQTMQNGKEQRNVNWLYARNRYDIAPSIQTSEQLEKLICFFRAHKGKAISFRFKDWQDYKAVDEAITFKREGVQLYKSYAFGNSADKRLITKPVENTVKITVNGIPIEDFKCDYTTGLVTFLTPRSEDATIKVSFDFDIHVRFDTDFLDLNMDDLLNQNLTIPIVEVK